MEIANAQLKKLSDGFSLIIKKCPFCGGTHRHGGGSLDDPRGPLSFQGFRSSDCGRGQYYVVITDYKPEDIGWKAKKKGK
jgi:hypothetical protein